MRKLTILLLIILPLSILAQDVLNIHKKNYNEEGLVVDNKGKLYTGKAKEPLKEGYLLGSVSKGDISGVWEFYEHNEKTGYHCYKNGGDIIYAFDNSGKLLWIEKFDLEKNTLTEIKVGAKNNIDALYVMEYNKDDSKKNVFEYEKFKGNYFDVTIADYDYNTLAVVDYFENSKGEQEIVMRDFDKHHELIKIIAKDHDLKEILFLGSLLDNPEDAEYSLEKGFNASFTEFKDNKNFKLSLLKEKDVIFDVFINDGQIVKIDKKLKGNSLMLLYTKEDGYVPTTHKAATELIITTNQEISTFLKK